MKARSEKSLITKGAARKAVCDAVEILGSRGPAGSRTASDARRGRRARGDLRAGAARRQVATRVRRRQAAEGRARFRRSGADRARAAAPAGGGAVGVVQARWRARPHPDRRSPGHQPRAMGDRRRPGRGILRRRGRRATAIRTSSRSATPSSRSTAFSAPTRRPFCACGSISSSASTTAQAGLAERAARQSRSARPSRYCRRSMRSSRSPTRDDGVALDGSDIRHVADRAGHAGHVELWPPVGRRAKTSLTTRNCRSPASASPSLRPGSPAPSPPRSSSGSPPASGSRRATGRSGPATSWCWCAGATNSSANCCAR